MTNHPRGDAVDPAKRYRIADPDDLTLNQMRHIKVATGVDVVSPDTSVQRGAALLWFAAHQAGEPIRYETFGDLTARQIADMIDDSDVDHPNDLPTPDPAPLVPGDTDDGLTEGPTPADAGSSGSTSADWPF